MKNKESKKGEVFKRGELRDKVLVVLGMSILVGGTIVTPNFPIVMGLIMKLFDKGEEKPVVRHKVRRVLKELEQNELVYLERKNDEVYVHLNKRNIRSIKKYSLRELLRLKKREISVVKEWSLVIFDVPEIQRNKRDHLRHFLRWLGFYPYQKSVYAYPGDCESEVKLIREMVEGGKYIKYILAKKIEDDDNLLRFFKADRKT